jgi:peroxiredoxin (alkyl hydroperoxide reductase subunit C)
MSAPTNESNPTPVKIGERVQSFTFNTYNPRDDRFEECCTAKLLTGKKWVILFFYPADFTFVCPTELADLANYHEELIRLGVEVISVSTDTQFSHLAWCKAEKLLQNVKFLMASDPTGQVARLFGIYDNITGTAFRGTFIINPEGVFVGAEINYANVGRNAAELLRKVKAMIYLRSAPDQACPAGWEEGSPTLTPSEAMVGNVYGHLQKK